MVKMAIYCGECDSEVTFTEDDIFSARKEFLDSSFTRFRIKDLGYKGIICPVCGREIILNDDYEECNVLIGDFLTNEDILKASDGDDYFVNRLRENQLFKFDLGVEK